MAAQREQQLSEAWKANLTEAVRSEACGVDSNEAKALRVAGLLECLRSSSDLSLTPQELHDAVEPQEQKMLAPLLALLTSRVLELGGRRERREERKANLAAARFRAQRRSLPAREVPRARPERPEWPACRRHSSVSVIRGALGVEASSARIGRSLARPAHDPATTILNLNI